jgi:hypothetical protein
MNKIFVIFLLALSLHANFFPETITTSISKVDNGTIITKQQFAADGMSCAIVHNYGHNIKALAHMCMQKNGKLQLIDSEIIPHYNIPTIITEPQIGDTVIGGYLYDNVLLLAPNETIYNELTTKYNKKFIHPDLYALFLLKKEKNKVTKRTLKSFAKRYQIGLVMIVKANELILYDPYSQVVIAKKSYQINNQQFKYPFYTHFKKLDQGWFSNKDNNSYKKWFRQKHKNYYKEMEQFR